MARFLDVFLGTEKVGVLEQDDHGGPGLSLRMAMKIGKEKEAAQVRMKHWLALYEDAGLGATMAIQRMRALATKARHQASALAIAVPLAEGVAQIIDRHATAILAHGAE